MLNWFNTEDAVTQLQQKITGKKYIPRWSQIENHNFKHDLDHADTPNHIPNTTLSPPHNSVSQYSLSQTLQIRSFLNGRS